MILVIIKFGCSIDIFLIMLNFFNGFIFIFVLFVKILFVLIFFFNLFVFLREYSFVLYEICFIFLLIIFMFFIVFE